MQDNWWKKSIVYQVYPKSFYDANGDGKGDLQGVIQKLDYLQKLGIDVIWLSPVYKSPMDDNGYDISDYQAIAEEFGTMDDMELLIQEAAKHNIKIIMDLVVNHTSDEHPWFIESKSSRDSAKRDWYIWRDGKPDGTPPNNWRSNFGGSSWEYDEHTEQYYLHVFSKKQPDLNWENAEVRAAVIKMVKWWLDKGIGGFRVDAITFIKKRQDFADLPAAADSLDGMVAVGEASLNQDGIDSFLLELNQQAFAPYDILTVAEAPGVESKDLWKFVGKNGYFSMLFEFDHVDLDLDKDAKWYQPRNWSVLDFKGAISKSQHIYNDMGWGALYLENHDQPRSLNKFIAPEHIGPTAAKMLATVYFLLRGTPFIYQGQEIGMSNVAYPAIEHYDDLASIDQYKAALAEGLSEEAALQAIWHRSRDNARTPMQWNNQKFAGFSSAAPWLQVNPDYTSVNVERALEEQDSVLHYYKQLIALRRDSEYSDVIINGLYDDMLADHPQVVAYVRSHEGKKLLVLANFTAEAAAIQLDVNVRNVVLYNYSDRKSYAMAQTAGGQGVWEEAAGEQFIGELSLRPYEAIVYELQ